MRKLALAFGTVLSLMGLALYSPIYAQSGPAPALEQKGVASVNFAGDPISFVAHGQLFDAKGKVINPNGEFIRQALDFYLKRLLALSDASTRKEMIRFGALLEEHYKDSDVLRNFLLMEFLTTRVDLKFQAHLEVRNHVLRKHWFMQLLGWERYKEEIDPRKNLPRDITQFGLEKRILKAATEASGKEYIAECRKAGVPIPPQWNGGSWSYKGDLVNNFLGFGTPTQVWRADSSSPKGLCVALPRFKNADRISAIGIICLGTESSKACFFDTDEVDADAKIDAEDLISGADLSNGVCTDCHAGENPYIVHPSGPLAMWPDNMPAQWHDPLIKPSWPQNPGPFALLDLVPINPLPPDNDASCLTCHTQTGNGRFPDILALNAWRSAYDGSKARYCTTVLDQAIGNTMPGLGSAHDKHAQAMKAFCGQNPPPPGEVPPPDTKDDPETLGPPVVIGPLYACAEAVEVSGASYGAKLTVRIDGADVNSVTVTQPSQTIVKVPALVAGQKVTAIQEENGVISAESQPVTVIDHTVAYPSGLPKPEIDPTLIHQCGRTIAVRHVRGAKVTIFTNGSNAITYSSGGDWTNMPPKIRPFNLNDRYSAQQAMCEDKSAIGDEKMAVAEPSPMPVPKIDPTPPLAGQEVIGLSDLPNGALTEVSESSAGVIRTFSTAVSWHSEVDIASGLGHALQPGEQLSVVSSLCSDTKISIPDARPCESLDAPKIAQPFVGDTHVMVTDSVPGAHVIVYDANNNEIGDGSGSPIGLTRALKQGDVLTVVQKLGECVSKNAFQISVICTTIDENGKACGDKD